MAKKRNSAWRAPASTVAMQRHKTATLKAAQIGDADERILREATKHLVFEHGMFLVATGLREASLKGVKFWIITVTLRYTTGHEGYIGDLLYDGDEFTLLTPPEVGKERARQIAAHPARRRKWDEHRASTLSPGKR